MNAVVAALVTLLILAAALPWLFQVSTLMTAFLLATLLGQCAFGAISSVLAGRRLLSVVFWTFSLCYLAIPAIYQVSKRQAAWGDLYLYDDETRLLKTLLFTNISFAMFALGTARLWPSRRGGLARMITSASPRRAVASAPRKLLLPIAYSGSALLLLPLVVSRTGGVGSLVSSRTERGAALAAAGIGQEQSGGATLALVGILPGALALAATYVLVLRWRQGERRGPVVLLGAAMLLFLYSNPFANTRYVSSVAIVSVLLLVIQPRKVKGLAVVAAALVVGVLGIYPLANAFRADNATAETVSLADNDFDGFQQLVNTQQYVEERGHTWGAHLTSAVLFALPRKFWVGKAEPASIPVAANRGYSFTNLSLPFPGELYLEFGVAGAGAGMFLWGRGWRRLEEDWGHGTETVGGALVPYLAIAQLGVLRGPVGSLVPVYATAVILLTIALYAERRRPSEGLHTPSRVNSRLTAQRVRLVDSRMST